MTLFFRLFDVGIPVPVILCTLLLALAASCLAAWLSTDRKWKLFIQVWIAACLFLMLYSTVIGRQQHDGLAMRLVPFWSIEAIRDGSVETLYEKIYNVIFFMPYGFLLGLHKREKSLRSSVVAGILTSMVIELLQLITRTGTCETDDVICNTLGCVFGTIVAVCARRIVRRVQ